MASFLTRVELHGATADDFDKLHSAMRALNFSKYIDADNGVRFELPSAEYFSFGDLSAEAVRGLAISAATTTGRLHWVITAEYTTAAWLLKPT